MAEKSKTQPPTVKIFIGYKTRLVPGADKNVPEFKPPPTVKDAAKAAAFAEESKAAFLAEARNMPYTGTFEEVFLVDPQGVDEKRPEVPRIKTLQYLHRPDDGKLPVAVRVRNYLRKHYPRAWSHDAGRVRPAEVVLVGFEVRTFAKILGLECSMPDVAQPCPVGLWYPHPTFVDIGEAVCPREYRGLTLPFVLKQRRPSDPERGRVWDAMTKDWPGPGETPERDVKIALELANQLGMLSQDA